MTKIVLYLAACFLGIMIALIANYFLGMIVIPDECYYHVKKPGVIINLFYSFPSWNGNHPTPSTFNYLLTFVIGIVLGCYLLNKFLR